MTYKFKVGDKVRCVINGEGLAKEGIGNIFTITELGQYRSLPGYKIDPPQGNTLIGLYHGFIGENSFELVESKNNEYYLI